MIGDDTLAEYAARVGNCMRGRQSLVRYLGAKLTHSFVAKVTSPLVFPLIVQVLPSTGRVTIPSCLFEGTLLECSSTAGTHSSMPSTVHARRRQRRAVDDGSVGEPPSPGDHSLVQWPRRSSPR